MKNIAILASGSGTNAEKIIQHFREHPQIRVSAVFCNKPGAGVIARAERCGVPVILFNKEDFTENDSVLKRLKELKTDLVVLAGFLWLIPAKMVTAFEGRIINIHPALLPKYGGKGFYGNRVHRAVLESGDRESGITIHYVNEHFDEGKIIFQARCPVQSNDTPETLAERIHGLEHRYFPGVIEEVISRL